MSDAITARADDRSTNYKCHQNIVQSRNAYYWDNMFGAKKIGCRGQNVVSSHQNKDVSLKKSNRIILFTDWLREWLLITKPSFLLQITSQIQ